MPLPICCLCKTSDLVGRSEITAAEDRDIDAFADQVAAAKTSTEPSARPAIAASRSADLVLPLTAIAR